MSTSKIRWLVVGLIVVAAMNYAMTAMGYHDYIESWGGTLFKALCGGATGWAISRFVIGLDISELPSEQRPMAAFSQAILIGSGMIALATGA